MEILTPDWHAAQQAYHAHGFKRRRCDAPPGPIYVARDYCMKSGVLDHLVGGDECTFDVVGDIGVTQASIADCLMLYSCPSKIIVYDLIKHWRSRLGVLISTAGYFGWEEIAVLADERMRERCSGNWSRDLRNLCVGADFDRDVLLDWFSEKLNYGRLHWVMVCSWIHGRLLFEWWDQWVPSSRKIEVFERFTAHFNFDLNKHCQAPPLKMVAHGFMNNMVSARGRSPPAHWCERHPHRLARR